MRNRVFILTTESPHRPGGQEHLVCELMNGLEKRGYLVEVLHRENALPAWLNSGSGRFKKKIAASLLGYFVGRLAQARLGEDVAAVISNSDVGYYRLRPVPLAVKRIHFYHGTYRGQAEAIRPLITRVGYLYLKWWSSMVLERFSGHRKLILCNSDQTRMEVSRYFGLSGTTVWYPLDTTHFRPRDQTECRRSLDLPVGGPLGLFVGSTEPVKGFPMVTRIARILPQVRWIFALRGQQPGDLKEISDLQVIRDAPKAQLPLLYGAADFTLCTSRCESFGYVVAEALACGTPVIASLGGASRLFLRDAPLNRLLISDPEALVDFITAVQEVLQEPQRYRRAVLERVRPQLEQIMGSDQWWQRFREITGL
jgi:glycosyltransferase involved in cell wall biosynthesis